MSSERVIILAAGMGSRLAPLTDNQPKCMVIMHGEPLLSWNLAAVRSLGIEDIVVVTGYKSERVTVENVQLINNPGFADTNMVYTLWCAQQLFGDEFIMIYGDIVYNPGVLKALLENTDDIAVVVDRKWRQYWEMRTEDILGDAESLQVDDDGKIVSIGQKTQNIDDIQGQYIGMVAFRGDGITAIEELVRREIDANKAGASVVSSGKDFRRLYMTDLLQGLINTGQDVRPVWIDGGWLEVDTKEDLYLATSQSCVMGSRLNIKR